MALLTKELGIDLGTSFTRVAEGGDVLLEEPTVAAIIIEEYRVSGAIGEETTVIVIIIQFKTLPHVVSAFRITPTDCDRDGFNDI